MFKIFMLVNKVYLIVLLVFGVLLCQQLPIIADNYNDKTQEVVVLLHGLGRTSGSMNVIQARLEKEGYFVKNINYPSKKYSCETLMINYIAPVLSEYKNAHKVHFVTHSLGGILTRLYLTRYKLDNLGAVVMLGPPNKGSGVVDKLRRYKFVTRYMGPAFLELSTDYDSLPNKLPRPYYHLGIIAGTTSLNPFLSQFLEGENDGKVTVDSAKIDGGSLKILPVSHTWMMKDKDVINNVVYFLKYSEFIQKNGAMQ